MKQLKVSMLYELNNERNQDNLKDKIFNDLEKKLETSKNKINLKYNSQIRVDSSLNHDFIRVSVEEKDIQKLEEVLRNYFMNSGLPLFVEGGSDYNMVNEILNDYGKELKRTGDGFLVGKCVVDIKNYHDYEMQLSY